MSKIYLEKYSISFSSSNRDDKSDKSPLNFTVWLNDEKNKSNIYRSFKNIKKVNFEHVVFPNYMQLIKTEVLNTDPSYNDIITVMSGFSSNINDQLTLGTNTYEICNAHTNIGTHINFTINGNTLESFEHINTSGSITIYKYTPISIDSPGNRIQFLSIHPCDNTHIYSTKNKNIFRYLFPKLKSGSDLYMYTRASTITYPNGNLLQMKKLIVQLMDNQGNPMNINNLDYNYGTYSAKSLNEDSDYSHPTYYLRHPLNPHFQLDIFISIECYEKKLELNSVFNK